MIRWRDSAILSHEPLSGVYSGITPWANNHVTMDVLRDGSHETQANRRTQRCGPVCTDESLPGSLVSWMADTESELILGTPS
jgi:hypothetical protein